MNNITKRLRHSVEVWHMIDGKNELGENEKIPEKFKNAFSEIVPQFKFTFRRKSVQGIQKDWFFIFEKEKYEVVYFNRDFKDNQFIEVFCKRIEE